MSQQQRTVPKTMPYGQAVRGLQAHNSRMYDKGPRRPGSDERKFGQVESEGDLQAELLKVKRELERYLECGLEDNRSVGSDGPWKGRIRLLSQGSGFESHKSHALPLIG